MHRRKDAPSHTCDMTADGLHMKTITCRSVCMSTLSTMYNYVHTHMLTGVRQTADSSGISRHAPSVRRISLHSLAS